jgi:hypothetical protein
MRYTAYRMTTMLLVAQFLIFAGAVLPVSALPPEVEADRLLLSAGEKMDKKDYTGAGQDLDKIKALGVKLPVEFYYQNGRYLASMRNAAEAKKNLETYLDKAGKEGKFYQQALKLFSLVEANEKRWGRFKANGDGTVTDTKTGLMWAAKDSGHGLSWANAKQYCATFSAGGHKDWRLPTQDELVSLYDKQEGHENLYHTPLIRFSGWCPWASETRGSEGAWFHFAYAARNFGTCVDGSPAVPVRSIK